ncbi:MAG: hypothetical protein HOW97_12595, partial [Catenulispora sp.]|nr:hypothetical protein [Catenulispora sp.]
MVPGDVRGLLSLAEPPAEGGDSIDWEGVAAETGWHFPADYRELVETFGSGEFTGNVDFGVPPRHDEPMDSGILRSRPPRAETARLMWGGNDSGDSYYWNCEDPDPDRWTVAASAMGGILLFRMGAVEFLVEMLTGRLDAELRLNYSDVTSYEFVGWR